MKAIQIHAFGTSDVLQLDEIVQPSVAEHQVLIKVHTAGINPIDIKTRKGVGVVQQNALPFILGWDVSGTIETLGNHTSQFQIGDAVYGLIAFPKIGATYAEYVVANESALAIKPNNIDYLTAGATPLAALTAWQALFEAGNLQSGQHVLIHAAAGGVGHIAVQLAKWCGATISATASKTRQQWLHELGVDQFIDYQSVAFEDVVHDVDLVLDTVGGEVGIRSIQVVKPNGVLVTLLGRTDNSVLAAAEKNHILAKNILVHPDAAQLNQITQLIENNDLSIKIDRAYPLTQAKSAHDYLEQGHAQGKVVLQVLP